jgi:hypothetical protein
LKLLRNGWGLIWILGLVGLIGIVALFIPNYKLAFSNVVCSIQGGIPICTDSVPIVDIGKATKEHRLELIWVSLQNNSRTLKSYIELRSRESKDSGFSRLQSKSGYGFDVLFNAFCGPKCNPIDLKRSFKNKCSVGTAVSDYDPDREVVKHISRQIYFSNNYFGAMLEDNRISSSLGRLARLATLPSYGETSQDDCPSCNAFRPAKEFVPPWQVVSSACAFFYAGFLLFCRRGHSGAIFCAVVFILIGGAMLLVGHERYEDYAPYKSTNPKPEFHNFLHYAEIVPQKHLDSI